MQEPDETAAARVGQVVDETWTLERLLGVGGMAAVYAARDADGAPAAVKVLHPEMGLKRDVRERFWREAYAANRVEHPGAVRVLGHGTDANNVAYLVMELLEGEPLSARAARHGVLPVGELLEYTDQILDVLAAAHERGIVHRDLKPDNLFITTGGKVKVLDFGVARFVRDAPSDFKTRTGTALGTLPYMAPEQALGRSGQIDGRADLFSIGATLFRILSGRRVHEADSDAEILMAMASKSAPPLRTVAPDVPEHVCAIVDLALAFSQDARYPDARTMQKDVQAARDGTPPPYVVGRNVIGGREAPTIVEPGVAAPIPVPSEPLGARPASAGATAPMPAVPETGHTGRQHTQPLEPVPTPPQVAKAAEPAVAATASMDGPPPSSTVPDSGPPEPGTAPAPTPVTTAASVVTRKRDERRPGLGVVVALTVLVLALLGGTVAAAVLLLRPSDPGRSSEDSASPPSEQAQGTNPALSEAAASAGTTPTAPAGSAGPNTAGSESPASARSRARVVREDDTAAPGGSAAPPPAAPPSAGAGTPASPGTSEESGEANPAPSPVRDVPAVRGADAGASGSPAPGTEATQPPARPRHGSRRSRRPPHARSRH